MKERKKALPCASKSGKTEAPWCSQPDGCWALTNGKIKWQSMCQRCGCYTGKPIHSGLPMGCKKNNGYMGGIML